MPRVAVTGIACEPDEIRPGDLYVALRHRAPGSIRAAVRRGAVAVVSESTPVSDPGVPVILVQDEVRALGHLAARLFGRPARALRTCGVTGSFGKTSVARIAAAGLEAAGVSSGVVDEARRVGPSPHRLQSRLRSLRDDGTAACVLEAGARDLVLGRFEGTVFDSAVFLGFRPRPQNFIDDDAECLDAKADLFRGLGEHAIAAFNRDDPAWTVLAAETRARVVTFGTSREADVRARVCGMDLNGSSIDVRTPVGTIALRTRLVGADHVSNTVAALTVALTLGADLDAVARGIGDLRSVPGRLEPLPVPTPYKVFLDTAPDPAAVSQALLSLRPLVSGRLIVVAGAPDNAARWAPRSAQCVEKHADHVIVTEGVADGAHPMTGVRHMMTGFRYPARVRIEPSRRRAVGAALESAGEDDVVLLLGVGDGSSDRRAVRDWFLADLEAEAACGPLGEE